MSRIGKRPIDLPEKVDVKIQDRMITVKGPKGELQYEFSPEVQVVNKDKKITVDLPGSGQKNTAIWGLTRTLISNMVEGVTKTFTKVLEYNGVGYKAQVKGQTLMLNLGYSHPIEYGLPKGVEAKAKGNQIEISGCSKELVGFVAAKVRSFRPPEPYKGKGIKYKDEVILRKAGKTGAKK